MPAKHPIALVTTSLVFSVTLAFGQSAAPATSPTSAPSSEQPITLNPFLVNAQDETGYRATNTLDGSRLNTALKDTPGAISVFTRDLLDDLGVTDVMDLLRYDVSAEESFGDDAFGGPGGEQGKAGDIGLPANWRTRGLDGSASTDGFSTVGKTDTYNVESVGSTRGPNAILFGTGAAGGVLNFRTKSANPGRNSNSVELKVGEYELYRAAVDFNRVLIKNKLALRVMGLGEKKSSYKPHEFTDKSSVTLGVHYKIRPETFINVSWEKTRTEAVLGRPWNPLDSVTRFMDELAAGRVVWSQARERYETSAGAALGAAQGVGALATRTALIQGPELGTPLLWEGATAAANRSTLSTSASRFTGTQPTVDESFARYGSVQYAGGAEFGIVEFENFTATLNHRLFEKFYVELAVNKSIRDSDTNVGQNSNLRADLDYRLPGGALNPYFFGNGYLFIQQGMLRQTQSKDNKTARLSLSYEVGKGRWWGDHRFAMMAERHISDDMSHRTRHVFVGAPFGGTPEAAANQVFRRRYFKIDGPRDTWSGGYNPAGPFTDETYSSATVPGRTLTTGWVSNNNLNFNDEITEDSQLFVMQNYFFKRRLVLTTGLRRDQIDTTSPNTVRAAGTQEWRLATAADQPAFAAAGDNWIETTSEKGGRKSIGGVLHVTKNFSLTANASTGVGQNRRNRTVLPEQRVPDASRGEGRDYGINFSFLDNKIAGSIKKYRSQSIQEGGQGLVEPVFVNPNNDVMSSFDFYYRQAGLTNLGNGALIGSVDELRTTLFSGANGYLSDRVSKGYEFEVIANPTRSWTVRANYSRSERMRTNVLAEGEGWWAERVALWESLDRFYMTRTGQPSIYNQRVFSQASALTNQTVRERIADSDRELASTRFREQQGYGNRKHKANVWTRYSLPEGRLKGLTLGGGWRYQSSNIAGINLVTREVYHGNAKSLFDFMAAYRTRGFLGFSKEKLSVTYQLNILNVLDDRTIFIAKIVNDTATGAKYTARAWREDPRMSTLTLRFAF